MSVRGSAVTALLCAALSVPAAPLGAAVHHPGKWSNPFRWTNPATGQPLAETAVNMMLLPVPDSLGATRARVLWWQDDHDHRPDLPPDTTFGAVLDWTSGSDAVLNAGHFPGTIANTGALELHRYPTPGYNIFCSGMGQLEDDQGWGRALIAGGTHEAENGSTLATVYDARTNTWTRTSSPMATGRWYPSVTTLPSGNGTALVTSGSRYKEGWLFGGSTVPDSTLYRGPFSYDPELQWNVSLLPTPDARHNNASPLARRGRRAPGRW